MELEDLQKELLINNWLFYIYHLERLVSKNYFLYRLLSTLSIIGGITIPAINVLPLQDNEPMITVSILGVITAVCISINETFKFNDKWKHFRRQVEMARIEGEKYISLAGEIYKEKSHMEALPIFMDMLVNIKNVEIDEYINLINKKDTNE